MKIGLVGASSRQRSLPFNAERTVNLFPVLDEEGKEVAALYGTPGLSLFSTCGIGVIRGMFYSTNGRAFVVSGDTLYEVDNAGTATNRGTLLSSSGTVTVDENPTQLGICDGTYLYTLTYSSNTFARVTDADLPTSGTLTFIDGYFVINKVDSGQFYISAINDGTSWDALDFATAESSPDRLLRVINAVGQLWLFGDKTTEIWTNTGDSAFPFERVSNAKMETGILARYSAVSIDNSVIWLGKDDKGQGIVYRARGFNPQRISNFAVEYAIQNATNLSEIRAYTYQQEGHVFYVLTGGGLETTWVYDLSTEIWHERAFLESDGTFSQHLGVCGMFAFGYNLVGDRASGNIYKLDMDVFSDNGAEILRQRTYTHLSNEGERVRYNALEIGFETGVGLSSGNGSDPVCSLRISKDGARTWTPWFTCEIGALGEYNKKVVFRRLGVAEQMTFDLRISDPVKVAITGSYLT